MKRKFDHIDLRVRNLSDVTEFYQTLLPALGFSQRVSVEGWLEFEGPGEAADEFFGITESPAHVPNENRIALWAESQVEVDQISKLAVRLGARNVEGPMNYRPGYYAVFFEDPSGNRFEICHRFGSRKHSPKE